MVLNSGGGNKGKHVARKFIKSAAGAGIKTVRVVQDEGEMYAVVAKLFGNCMCKVVCFDGRSRLCIIRKKFTGRRKTDNVVSQGSVLLVGLHVYSSGTGTGGTGGTGTGSKVGGGHHGDSNLPRCDLLYVYNDQEKEKLRKVCDLSKMNTAPTGGSDAPLQADDDSIKFVLSGTGVFNKYANPELRKGVRSVGSANESETAGANSVLHSTVVSNESWLKDMYPDECSDEDEEDEEDETGEAGEAGEEDEDEDEDEDEEGEGEDEEILNKVQPQQKVHSQTHNKKPYSIINIDDI